MKTVLYLLLFNGFVLGMPPAAHPPQPLVDANGYHYKNENAVQDKRKIAILSYGSLVRQSENMQTHAKLEATAFNPTEITLPVSLTRQSQGPRFTAVIDRDGDLKRVWVATSRFQSLPNARNNLAAREGSVYRGQETGYDLTNIFYMKKLLPGRVKDNNEQAIPQTANWVIRSATHERQQLPTPVAQQVARWADNNGYSAIIWASFPPNISSRAEAINRLLQDGVLLRNTQEYVRNLPDGAQSAFEQAILAGANALRVFTAAPAACVIPAPSIARQTPIIQEPLRPATVNTPVSHNLNYQNFTFYQQGDLPILLTAPHGGTKTTGVPARTGINPRTGQAIPMFVTVWDDGTLELAQQVSDEIYRLTGMRPYFVAADFTRKEVDANRPTGLQAYETAGAKQIYDFYHERIKEYIDEIRNRFGNRAILIDIHGHGCVGENATIFRGTRDKTTVKQLIAHNGEASFTGPHSILGILGQKNYKIFPHNDDLRTLEKRIYSGGYTVGAYGSQNPNGIDAIQLENGCDFRRGSGLTRFARDLAEAIVGFYKHYLTSH